MNEPEYFYQVVQLENRPSFRVQRKDGEISDWIDVKELLRERDELAAKLGRIKSIATSGKDYSLLFGEAISSIRFYKITKECE